jgi:hypothetical protein
MEPNMYALLKAVPFTIPINPGDTPISTQFATPSHMKMADAIFLHIKNYYLSYKNINRACFKMLDENVQPQYKVSNVTTMMGWNATMSVRLILEQLEGSYGKPNMMTIHQNDLLFQSPFLPSKAPEMLFYRIEQCQEIQTIAEDPYTPKQIISNAVRLLMVSGMFPLKEFDTWEALPIKMYPILKTVGRRGTNQLRLLERYLDVLVKHTTEIPPPTALVEGIRPICLSRRRIAKMIYFKL